MTDCCQKGHLGPSRLGRNTSAGEEYFRWEGMLQMWRITSDGKYFRWGEKFQMGNTSSGEEYFRWERMLQMGSNTSDSEEYFT